MAKKLLFVCSKKFPGSIKVLENLIGVLSGMMEIGFVFIEDGIAKPLFKSILPGYHRIEKKLNKRLYSINIDKLLEYENNLIFAGWGSEYGYVLEKLNKHGLQPSLIMCSTIGQAELTKRELFSYRQILSNLRQGNIKYWLLNKRLFDTFGSFIERSIYFPHVVDLKSFDQITTTQMEGNNLDLFCAIRNGKNILNQVLAYKLSNIPGSLHINFEDPDINALIDLFDIKVVRHKWIPGADYYRLVSGMALSLQVTFTESFSYAVCERMCLSIPVITSYDVDLISGDEFLAEHLCVSSLDTPSAIARKIRRVLMDAKLRKDLALHSKKRIENIARVDNQLVCDTIKRLFL
ncbi:MAG: hypothetical protein A2V66_15640 [Ignavibacteria bacterium RBG_13_36_8]|nr:MAG: hypothetical protein A2V66_15640 [Ignavibacteria bacterium RBG_13_36_8]